MEQQLNNILTTVATDTLEKLAFLFAFPDDQRVDDSSEPAVAARVEFGGYFDGCLWMRISAGAVPELANNMLGLRSVSNGELVGFSGADAMGCSEPSDCTFCTGGWWFLAE